MGICYIVGARPLDGALGPREEGDLLIAADGGLASLERLGEEPDLVVGDFDSLGRVPRGEKVTVLPREKDDTDTMYALRLGLERGFRRFLIYGGLGGRLDHTVANLQTLVYLNRQGAFGLLAGEGMCAVAVTEGTLVFPAGLRGYCSVFSAMGEAGGVTLEGLKYPLDRADLTGAFPLGVSNEFTGVPARVRVEKGTLLVLWEDQGGHRELVSLLQKEES